MLSGGLSSHLSRPHHAKYTMQGGRCRTVPRFGVYGCNTTLVMVSQSPRFCRESGQLSRNVVNFPLCGGFTTKFCINHSQRSNPNYLVPTHETTPTIATSPAPRANPVRDKFVERLEPDNAGIVKKPGIFPLSHCGASLSFSVDSESLVESRRSHPVVVALLFIVPSTNTILSQTAVKQSLHKSETFGNRSQTNESDWECISLSQGLFLRLYHLFEAWRKSVENRGVQGGNCLLNMKLESRKSNTREPMADQQ